MTNTKSWEQLRDEADAMLDVADRLRTHARRLGPRHRAYRRLMDARQRLVGMAIDRVDQCLETKRAAA